MSFESCVREQAEVLKEDYEEDIAEGDTSGFKADFVEHIECTLDFIFLFEKIWGSFLVGPFRDTRKFLAILQARAKTLLDFGKQSELRRISLDANAKAAKAFYDKLRALEKEYRGCPPVQGLILMSSMVSFSYAVSKINEDVSKTFSEKNILQVGRREAIRVARNEVAKLLNDPSPDIASAALKILAASAIFGLNQLTTASPETKAEFVASIGFLMLYLAVAGPSGDDETSTTGSEQISSYLSLLTMISGCLQVEGIDLDSPEFKEQVDALASSDPDSLQASQRFFDETLGVPRPDASKLFKLPPL